MAGGNYQIVCYLRPQQAKKKNKRPVKQLFCVFSSLFSFVAIAVYYTCIALYILYTLVN